MARSKVLCKIEEVFHLISSPGGDFYPFCTWFECCLKEGEATSATRDGNRHNAEFAKQTLPILNKSSFSLDHSREKFEQVILAMSWQ